MALSDVSNYARTYIGIPYIYGGNNRFGIDCSGLICEILKAYTHGLIHRTEDLNAQMLFDRLFKTYKPYYPEEGAILFFGETTSKINHVAYSLSKVMMIEAGGGDSGTNTKEIASQKNAFVRIRPILSRKDYVGAILPEYLDVLRS